MTLLLIYILIVAAVVFIAVGISSGPKESTPRIPLPAPEGQKRKRIILFSVPQAASQKILKKFKLDVNIKRRLDAAHLKLSPEGFFMLKLLLMFILSTLVVSVARRVDPITLSGPLIFGYLLPDILLNAKISRRKQAVAFYLPEVVDLIGLCVEAGLDFTAALRWIIEKVPSNPMIEELSLLLEEIKWGKTRAQALKDLSRRVSIPEINSFVQTLIQAERMGTPVSEAFKIISEDTREMRFNRGERLALKAPLKILIPLVFCILPVIAIIIGGPLLLQFMQGGLTQTFGR